MNKSLKLRVNRIRRKIAMENIIGILIIAYIFYSYYATPVTSAKSSAVKSDMQSCHKVCNEEYDKCSHNCSKQLEVCRNNVQNGYTGCGDKCSKIISSTCSQLCINSNDLCTKNCYTKYTYISNIYITPDNHPNYVY
jgi:2-hydroxy-3-keto-5-methylthiopentenyl-1-phosphate phosphatase